MKITWIGQAGLLFEMKSKIILVDPLVTTISPLGTAINSKLE